MLVMDNRFLALNIAEDFPIAQNFSTLGSLLNLIIPLIMIIATIIFLFMMIYGAISIMNAGGTPENLERAKKIFQFSILGFIIIVTSYLSVKVIARILNIDLPL